MSAGALWLVRHAPVDAAGICYGQSDVPVTIPPDAAADRVLGSLPGRPARVTASPWARARDLGAALAARLGVALFVDARLAEMSFGAWEGRAFADLAREDAARFSRWMTGWRAEAPPGGETVAELEARVVSWLSSQREARQANPGPSLVVTHAGPIRALRKLLRGLTWDAVMGEPVEHLAVEPFDEDPGFALRASGGQV